MQGPGLAKGQSLLAAALTLLAQLDAPFRLLPQGSGIGGPEQIGFSPGLVPHVLAEEHPGHIVGKLLSCTVVLMGAVGQGRPVIGLEARGSFFGKDGAVIPGTVVMAYQVSSLPETKKQNCSIGFQSASVTNS